MDNKQYQFWIPIKFPSLNQYINECRRNRYSGASMKRKVEESIYPYIKDMPKFDKPIKIRFLWTEENKRRDFDNIAFAKKFILDAMQKYGKLENDNRKWVVGFTDNFTLGEQCGVFITINEVSDIVQNSYSSIV